MKTCNICLERRSLDDFYANKKAKDGRQSCCKDCRRAYLAANSTRVKKVNRDYKIRTGRQLAVRRPSSGPAKRRHQGLHEDQYLAILGDQLGTCAICAKDSDQRLAVDHCHKSGEIRGLLCRACNLGLGFFGDDIQRIEVAAAYLRASHE